MSDVYIAGIGMTRFGRFMEKSVKDLTADAVDRALKDASARPVDVTAAFFSNVTQSPLEGQYMVAGQIALRAAGFETLPITNVENACASASTAFHLAYAQVKAGLADVVLAVGVEKMYHADKARSFQIFEGAWDIHEGAANVGTLMALGRGIGPRADAPAAGKSSIFMEVYAAWAKFHMKTYGTTQRQLAAVAAKNHRHSTLNPLSQYRHDMSIDEVLAGRMVSWPLTVPMCSPISDGAAAAILVSEAALDRFDRRRAVKVHASVLASGSTRDPQDLSRHATRLAALKAYEAAGLGPGDMSVAEVHDATAFGEIQQTENLGLCEPGQGGWIAERGETTLGGRIPVNPSGGLESKGHPIGATGIAQLYELAAQLRGEAGPRQVADARFGIAENGGGFLAGEEAAVCITILGR